MDGRISMDSTRDTYCTDGITEILLKWISPGLIKI